MAPKRQLRGSLVKVGDKDRILMTANQKNPCIALKGKECLIYEHRPWTCRQFLCGKEYKEDRRPWKGDGTFNKEYFGKLLKNERFIKIKKRIEKEGAKWANSHGWKLVEK